MKAVEEYTLTRTLPQDQSGLYELISGIEKYPDFVPGYQSVFVRERAGKKLYVTQTVRVLGWETTFDSIATLEAPRSLVIDAFPPGFRTMRIEWRLDRLGAEGTQIAVTIRYEARNRLMSRMSRPWIQAFAETQLKAFRERANRLDRD